MSFIIKDSRFSPSPFFWSRVHSCSHCVLIFFCCSCLLNETRQEKWSYYIPSLFVGPSSEPELYYFSCTKKYFLTVRTIFYFEQKSNIVLPRLDQKLFYVASSIHALILNIFQRTFAKFRRDLL